MLGMREWLCELVTGRERLQSIMLHAVLVIFAIHTKESGVFRCELKKRRSSCANAEHHRSSKTVTSAEQTHKRTEKRRKALANKHNEKTVSVPFLTLRVVD